MLDTVLLLNPNFPCINPDYIDSICEHDYSAFYKADRIPSNA